MNDTSKPTNTPNTVSYDAFENGLEAMIIALELYKTHAMAIPGVALAAINLAGPMMLNTLAHKFGWSSAELIARLHAQREQLNEVADPMNQLAEMLGGALVQDQGKTEVKVHAMGPDEMEQLRAAIKAGDAKGIDAVINAIVDKGNGQTIAPQDNPAQGV